MRLIEKLITDQHYKKLTWGRIFIPLSYLFFILLSLRKFFYKLHIFKSSKITVPVIVIGNITLGGTGKTPLVISLAKDFKKRKLDVGIIARGYKSKFSHAREVLKSSDYRDVGDEPLLLKQKLDCPVYVGINRLLSAKKLLNDYPNIDLIISDDGLQHYALSRDFEILVVDGMRNFGNQFLLPTGPLREPIKRLKHIDAVIINRPSFSSKKIENSFKAKKLDENILLSLHGKKNLKFINLKDNEVIAMTGIGNPESFFNTLKSKNITFEKRIFSDHYEFKQKDFDGYMDKNIIMTEKDALKCIKIKHNKIWVLPLTLSIETAMINKILQKVGLS